MHTTVAVVRIQDDSRAGYTRSLLKGIDLIGGLGSLNSPARGVSIKVGIFDPRHHAHATVPAVGALIDAFDRAPAIRLIESDNYCGKAIERLDLCFKELYSERTQPFSLSDDPQAKMLTILGQEMAVSSIMLKPNVFVSIHSLRTFARGSVLKNLFGCTPEVQKSKYHKGDIMQNLIADLAQAAGGIDLAVLDGTYLFHAASGAKVEVGVLVIGKDAAAVEAVGADLAGLKPEKNAIIQEFIRRGLGEGDLSKIDIVGVAPDEYKQLKGCKKELKKLLDARPRQPGIGSTINDLIKEGWFATPRSARETTDELLARGVPKAQKPVVETTLKRRTATRLDQLKSNGVSVYRNKQK